MPKLLHSKSSRELYRNAFATLKLKLPYHPSQDEPYHFHCALMKTPLTSEFYSLLGEVSRDSGRSVRKLGQGLIIGE